MNKMFKIFAIVFFVWAAGGCMVLSKNREDETTETLMKQAGKPGLAVVVIDKKHMHEEYYFGYKNIKKQEKISSQTVFNTGSISKMITAIAVMQMVEAGKIDLDEDINTYLDFKVENPYYRNSKITMRMLLNHTSTIDNNWVYEMAWMIKSGDPVITLREFVKGYLARGGKYYHKGNFVNKKPGENYFRYSNPGIALAAYIVEKTANEEFSAYVTKNIFKPLEMDSASYYFKNMDTEMIARPYERFLGIYLDKGLYSAPFYPAGFMKCTACDLGKLMEMVAGEGKYKDRVILGREYFADMIKADENVKPDDWDRQGLVFQHKYVRDARLVGHTGGFAGIAAIFYYSFDSERGIILLMNGSWKDQFDGNRMNEKEISEIFFRFYNRKK